MAMQVVVFNIDGREIPIVHRSIKVHERRGGVKPYRTDILTKVASHNSLACPHFAPDDAYLISIWLSVWVLTLNPKP